MRSELRKKSLVILIGCLLTGLMIGCDSYGTKLDFNGGELYYTKNTTEADAKKLGDYLVKGKYFDGEKKTVQLDKSGDTYQVRMVVKEGTEKDEKNVALFQVIANDISKNVFGGAKTEIHLCDDHLKTQKVVSMNG